MPKAQLEYSEEEILELVRNDVRERNKLKKEDVVKATCMIDRDEEGIPSVTVAVEFEETIEAAKGRKK